MDEAIRSQQVLGFPISCLNMDETLAVLDRFLIERKPRLVVTADATALVIASDDESFRNVLLSADLVTADSVGVVWAMRRAGNRNACKVSGVDLVERLVQKSAQSETRIFFLGAAPGVAEKAAQKIEKQYPGCKIVGTHDGYFSQDRDFEVAELVASTKPDVLFVAMGMPRQENFIVKTQELIKAPIAMGVGGSFDVFSGRTRRAPVLFQRARIEWLWRLILNPSKISKVKMLPRFVRMVLQEKR